MEFTQPVTLASALLPIVPEIGLTLLALIILAIDMTTPEERRGSLGVVAALGVGVILGTLPGPVCQVWEYHHNFLSLVRALSSSMVS